MLAYQKEYYLCIREAFPWLVNTPYKVCERRISWYFFVLVVGGCKMFCGYLLIGVLSLLMILHWSVAAAHFADSNIMFYSV
jgi:hypothetical protein